MVGGDRLVHIYEDGPARTIYKGHILEEISKAVRQTAFRGIELVDLGIEPGGLKFLTKGA